MLHIHRSERADALVEALAGLLAETPADPFARELVAVPTRGMERWLTQRLSLHLGVSAGHGDGVCAGIDFPFPSRLLAEALALGSGVDPEHDPWSPERMVWPLMEVTAEHLDEAWLAPLARHLEQGDGRRYTRLRHLAGLFDHYALNRPELIRRWAGGQDGPADRDRTGRPDEAARRPEDAGGWQSHLWRAVRARIDLPSGPERLASARERLIADPSLVGLPQRLTFFGLTRLASAHVQLLDALAEAREIHLMLLHPSPALWDAVGAELSTGEPPPRRRADDPTAALARHRLLASWGRDARELQLVLAGIGATDRDTHHPPSRSGTGIDADHGRGTSGDRPAPEPRTLLGALQAGVREDRRPPGPPLLADAPDARMVLDPSDTSLRIHACHGRARQVAVLREAILHRLSDDPTLEPRDIIVMCPDVEEFAPLIQAAFGSTERTEGDLRVRLADRSLRQTNPLLALAARLLELAGARLTASEVLDLLDLPPVRRRFSLSDDDLAQVRGWVVEAQIHWGLDGEHRSGWKLGGVESGTWLRGLRRLLLSAAVADGGTELFGGALPAAAIDSDDIELVGTLAELLDRLAHTIDRLSGPLSVHDWVMELSAAVDALAEVAPEDAGERQELSRLLESVAGDAGAAGELRLSLAEVRALLAERLRGRPTRANFRTGHLTVATLHPMRSIPHRVIGLLGFDDQAFPRRAPRDGDDLLAAAPQIGDRDPRAEDRQLLLDALMAAQDALIVTYSGNDERTNAELAPAVPVGELLDVVEATARVDGGTGGWGLTGPGAGARDCVLIRHPLQAFDPRNFSDGVFGPGPWSFDRVALSGARILARGTPEPAAAFLEAPLRTAPREDLVALSDLIAWAQWPARAFLRQRLGVSVSRWEDELDDAIPVEFDGLDRYGVGQRLLDAVLAGADWPAAIDAEMARGTLPPGELGRPIVKETSERAERIAVQARVFAVAEPRTFETNLLLSAGRRLTGTVSGVHDGTLLSVSYASLGARQRLSAWVRLLVLTATHPEVPWEAVTLGRASRERVTVARISTLAGSAEGRAAAARAELDTLLDLRAEGLTRALVIPAKTAEAYVAAQAVGTDAEKAADQRWASQFRMPGEGAEAEHELIFSGVLDRAALARDAPRLWGPLREHERVEFL